MLADDVAFLHTAREFVRMLVGEFAQADLTQELLGTLTAFFAPNPSQLQAKGDIIECRQPRIERGLLKNQGAIGIGSGDRCAIIEVTLPDVGICRPANIMSKVLLPPRWTGSQM